ncbi:MAG: PBSX family phage terminase large subunit [Oscillospiraceae bacterium]
MGRLRAQINNNTKSLLKQAREGFLKFKPFSEKQKKVLSWWCETSPVKDYNGIIADGSIRSGKTLSMSLGFVFWAMETFDGQNLALCGKTIGALRRNVIFWLKLMLRSRGYTVQDRRTDNLLIIRRNGKTNYFYLFGGKDERSQDLIQGITLAGAFFDEVAIMPESFVNQATGRCSVEGSKYWFNCNPQGPQHWFYKKWIKACRKRGLLYLHFTMDDNLSLSQAIKERYMVQYVGVFFQRYILGLWVVAEGAIYRYFTEHKQRFFIDTSTEEGRKQLDYDYIQIGFDPGKSKSAHALVATGIKRNGKKLTALKSKRIKSEGTTPEDIYSCVKEFIRDVREKYASIDCPVYCIYVDVAEQTLINGLRNCLDIPVYPSIKNEIIDRIRATLGLMASGRFFYTDDCMTLEKAFDGALYDPKSTPGKDERLDDGKTSDIDTLDGFEYSWESEIRGYLYV